VDRERRAEDARPDALDRCFPQPSERARKLAQRYRFGRDPGVSIAAGGAPASDAKQASDNRLWRAAARGPAYPD
jgi:hypothetical protein